MLDLLRVCRGRESVNVAWEGDDFYALLCGLKLRIGGVIKSKDSWWAFAGLLSAKRLPNIYDDREHAVVAVEQQIASELFAIAKELPTRDD